ncbi:MAG: NrtA/SsuA/CpmA family ABC transporter substrate-binding protein [Gordonia sp. (in: high G+C Gram-positive bacteria)]
MNRTRLASLILAAAMAVGLSACSDDSTGSTTSEATVTIRIPDPGNSGGLAKAKKDGSLDAALAKVGAKVAWTGSSGPFAPAALSLDNNQIDVAEGSITSAIAALAQKAGFKLFSAIAPDNVAEGILVKDSSNIRTVADLVGKKVVVWHGGSSEYLLLKALQLNNIPASSVERVYLQPGQSAAVLHSGQVDAWATWSTFSISERANANEHFLVDGGQIGSKNYAVWAVRNGFLTDHPKVLRAFYDFVRQQNTKVAADPEPYLNVVHTSGPDAVTGREKELLIEKLRAQAPEAPIGATELADFREVAQFFADQHVTEGVFNIEPHVVDITTVGS